jgi:hypothetical protein
MEPRRRRRRNLIPITSAALSLSLLALAFATPGSAATRSSRAADRAITGKAGIVSRSDVQPLAGGGEAYTYDIGGVKVQADFPPAGFNPLRASAARLAEYDFPPRPAGGRALRTWISAVRHAHRAAPPTRMRFWQKRLQPASAGPSVTVQKSTNWAGNEAIDETYTNVYGYWLEPSITTADCGTPQMESTWAGIGGSTSSAALAQAGTQYGENYYYGSGLSNHQAWYEMISGSTNDFVPLPVTATVGGEMYVNIYRASSSGYNVYVVNEYTGASWGINFVTFSPYSGSSAEFIEEDPYGAVPDGVYLIRFGTFEVQDAEASVNDSTFQGLASWPHDDDIMYADGSAGGDELAHAGAAFNSGDSWDFIHDDCA